MVKPTKRSDATCCARRPGRCRSCHAADSCPIRTLTVDELAIDRTNVAEYAAVTGLRYGDAVPLTYPFALTFPSGDVAGDRVRLPFRRNGIRAHGKPDHPVPPDRGDRHRQHRGPRREPARAPQGPAGRRRHRRQRRQRGGLASGHDVPASATHQPVRRAEAAAAEAAEAAAAQRDPADQRPARSVATPPSAATTTRSTPTRSGPSCSASRP